MMKKFSKIFMVCCLVFYQLNMPLTVLAEEVSDNQSNNVNSNDNTNNVNSNDNTNANNNNLLGIGLNQTTVLHELGMFISDTLINNNTYDVELSNKNITFTWYPDVVGEYYVKVNGDNLSNVVTNSGEGCSRSINYDGLLYGTYTYVWEAYVGGNLVDSYTLTVNYNSDSSSTNDIENTNLLSTSLIKKISDGNIYLLGNVNDEGIVYDDFVASLPNSFGVSIYDSNNVEVVSGNILQDMKIKFVNECSYMEYNIVYVGDSDKNNIVDNNDVIEMSNVKLGLNIQNNNLQNNNLDSNRYDVNFDDKFDILDISKTLDAIDEDDQLNKNGWNHDVLMDNFSTLNLSLENDAVNTLYINDTFTVRFSLSNFLNDTKINTFSGKIIYDKNMLELSSVTANGMNIYINDDGEFILVNEYNSEDDLIEITFTTLGSSDNEEISFSSLEAAYNGKSVNLSSNSISTNVEISYSSNKGGDVAPEESTEKKQYTFVNDSYILSSDSYLSKLFITGHDITFSPYTFKYTVRVSSDTTSLDLAIVLSDNKASYVVYGNDNFVTGENIVSIVVTAEDKSTHTYVIVVNKEEVLELDDTGVVEDEIAENNVAKTIIIVLIVMVIVGLVYLIFKDDEEANAVNNNNKNKKE